MHEKIAEIKTNGAGDGCVPAQPPSLSDSDDVLKSRNCRALTPFGLMTRQKAIFR